MDVSWVELTFLMVRYVGGLKCILSEIFLITITLGDDFDERRCPNLKSWKACVLHGWHEIAGRKLKSQFLREPPTAGSIVRVIGTTMGPFSPMLMDTHNITAGKVP